MKQYKPGTPEFDEITKTITHITKVKSEAFPKNKFYEAPDSKSTTRRRENVDKLR